MRVSRGTLFAAVAVIVVLAVVCGDDPATEPETTTAERTTTEEAATEEAATKPDKPTPLGCLEDAGLDRPEKRASDFWRGTDPNDGTLVRVSKFGSRREVAAAVADATDVHAEKGGRYAVFGAFKDGGNDGSNVRLVATCLAGR